MADGYFYYFGCAIACFTNGNTNNASASSLASDFAVGVQSSVPSSAPLSVRQQNLLSAFNDTIQGDVEDTIKQQLKHPDTAVFNYDMDKLSVDNAIFNCTGNVSYTNANNKATKDDFTVKIMATDKVYYPLSVKLGKIVSQDITKGTNSLGIATSSGKSFFGKTEGESIFSSSDGNIVFISDEVNEEMSLDEYNKIETGMSYADVTEIVGSYGNEEAKSDVAGYSSSIFTWVGAGPTGSNANVTFQNGRVIAKAQVGLQ